MASVDKITLIDEALTASKTSDPQQLQQNNKDFIAWQSVSGNSGTVDTVLQHSPDKTNWITFATFAQVAGATGTEAILPGSFTTANQPLFPNIRAVSTLSANATVKVELFFDPGKH